MVSGPLLAANNLGDVGDKTQALNNLGAVAATGGSANASGPAGGVLSGTYPNPVFTAGTVASGLIFSGTVTAAQFTATGGPVDISAAGFGFKVAEGANAKQGTATLNGTTSVVIANTSVTASSRIFLGIQSLTGTAGAPYVATRSAGTSFTIRSTNNSDTSLVAFEIVEPG